MSMEHEGYKSILFWLTYNHRFTGLRAILSGPAGGVVGYAGTSFDETDRKPVIG
jgi:N-methylhydantoinase A/oxoprolinase/acetone carboxylase beta subunit